MSGSCALPMRFLLAVAVVVIAIVTVIACAGYPLSAQQTPPPSQAGQSQGQSQESSIPLFRKSVHRVILDVVVTDLNEKPVRGLTRDDFSVAEDGRPQRVLSFDVHDFEAPPEAPPAVSSLPPNTYMNVPTAPERGPLYVVLYDMVNMNMDDQGTARKQLLSFINNKPAGTRFAIFVLSDGLRLVQGFTADQRQLFAALDPKSPRPHVPKMFLYGDNYGRGNIGLIRWAFTEVAHFLDALPGRKNVIWFTGSLSASFLPGVNPNADANTGASLASNSAANSASNTATNSGSYAEGVNYSDDLKKAIDAMARSQVAVYPVDVRGVVLTHVKANPGGMAQTDSPELYATYATEDDIAIATGGHAFYSTNDLKDALTQATETGGSYYTLTYSPTNQNYDGQLRKLRVELSKRGYHLAYRRAYYGYNPDAPPPQQGKHPASDPPPAPKDSLFANMQHGAPLTHQLLFKAHLHPVGSPARATPEQMANLISGQPEYFRVRGKSHSAKALLPIQLQTYAIDYTVVVDRSRVLSARTQAFIMEVAAAAYDGEGVLLNGNVENAAESITISPGEGLQASTVPSAEPSTRRFHRAQQLFDVPVNAKSIRLAVRDVTTDRVGAMEVPLPLGHEPETQADAPMAPEQPSSPEAAQPKPD